MDKKTVIQLRKDLQDVLDKFNETSDIKAELKDCTYGTEAIFKLHCTYLDNGNKQTKESNNFLEYNFRHNLPKKKRYFTSSVIILALIKLLDIIHVLKNIL